MTRTFNILQYLFSPILKFSARFGQFHSSGSANEKANP
jgi:hypothetical protein